MIEPILSVTSLKKYFPMKRKQFGKTEVYVKAVDGVDFDIYRGETLGLVGESGCGKSTVGRTILKLYQPTEGNIIFDGTNITHLSKREMKPLRSKMQMIFQDPYSSLNPRHTVGQIVGSSFSINGIEPAGGIKKAVQELLERVGLSPEHINRFPSEFSGGQRQRIGIARALALKPKLIVADEPVSALDVSIQAQVVNLLSELQQDMGISYLFIAHDLSVVQHISDRVVVMYLGKVMEVAPTRDLFSNPRHPYTKALLSAVPIPDPRIARTRERITLKGDLPTPINPPQGCVFSTRCWKATELCVKSEPKSIHVSEVHQLACHYPD